MLVIEDGTGKADATSVASVADVRTYALARGLTVPANDGAGDTKIEQGLILAMDYLQTDFCYKGCETVETQGTPFPRKGVVVGKKTLPDNVVPKNFISAQIELAIEVTNGASLMPTISGSATDYVVKEKVGPLETEYANPAEFTGRATFTKVDSLLASLLGGECCPSEFGFTVFRA